MPPLPTATNSTQALNNMQDFQKNMVSPEAALQQSQQQLGVQSAQQQVGGLRDAVTKTTNLLRQVAPTVQGNTTGTLVTAGQVGQQINNAQAPLQQDLSANTQAYNEANANYTDLQNRAQQIADSKIKGQNDQLSALDNLYSKLFTAEQARQAQENTDRQFRASQASTNALGSLFNNQPSQPTQPNVTNSNAVNEQALNYRVPGDPSQGFAFTDNKGQTINALQYSQGHQIPFRTLLQQMADKGDVGAKAGLQFIGNDGNADPTKVTSKALADLYFALTGRTVGIMKNNSSTAPLAITNNNQGASNFFNGLRTMGAR